MPESRQWSASCDADYFGPVTSISLCSSSALDIPNAMAKLVSLKEDLRSRRGRDRLSQTHTLACRLSCPSRRQ